ncbi:LpqB family beta-propeller domain-containing protein [Micromonospora sp. BRA006-A]|nr:LpqB family beta-propeller domain-containing protein [Micromonospora sp. BRA006-A]
MTALNRRALLRTAALTGLAAATGVAAVPHAASAAPAAADVVNGSWLVSVGWGVLQVDPGRTTPRELLPNGDHAKSSPDGRYVAWVNTACSGDGTLEPFVAVYDRVTGQKRTLLADPFGVRYGAPTWSPDGSEIALVTGLDNDRLIAVDVVTGTTRVLVEGHSMRDPDWSRDGSMIVVRWRSRSQGWQLRVLELATGTVRPVYTPVAGEMFISPVFMPDPGASSSAPTAGTWTARSTTSRWRRCGSTARAEEAHRRAPVLPVAGVLPGRPLLCRAVDPAGERVPGRRQHHRVHQWLRRAVVDPRRRVRRQHPAGLGAGDHHGGAGMTTLNRRTPVRPPRSPAPPPRPGWPAGRRPPHPPRPPRASTGRGSSPAAPACCRSTRAAPPAGAAAPGRRRGRLARRALHRGARLRGAARAPFLDRVTGQVRTLISDAPGNRYGWPTWSPDSTEIALVVNGSTLVAVDVATGGRRVLVEGHSMMRPNWSRDGSMIVMEWTSRSNGGQLRVLELATGKARLVLQRVPGEFADHAVFTPDSQRIVFSTNRWYLDQERHNLSLASVRIGGTGLKKLTDEPRFIISPVFSPDGRCCAALSVPDSNPDADGGNIIVFTSGFGEPWWIPGDEYDDSMWLDWAPAVDRRGGRTIGRRVGVPGGCAPRTAEAVRGLGGGRRRRGRRPLQEG